MLATIWFCTRLVTESHCRRAGVKYVLSNTNTNTNTKIWIFQIQIQIQIFCSTLIQIQIQIHRFKYKYKYKYVQPNISAKTVQTQNRGNSINPKIYAHGLCFLMFRWHLKFTPFHYSLFQNFLLALEQLGGWGLDCWIGMLSSVNWLETL